jgi:hypothetical protein
MTRMRQPASSAHPIGLNVAIVDCSRRFRRHWTVMRARVGAATAPLGMGGERLARRFHSL